MADTNTEGTVTDENLEAPAKDADEGSTDKPNDEGGEGDKLSHDDALAALNKARKDAGNYRTRLRDLESQWKDGMTPDQVEEVRNQLKADNASEARTLLVENVALKHKLPDDLASALIGSTREELEAHAKVLAKYAPVIENDDDPLEGGLRPGDDSDSDVADMAAHVRRVRNNRY